MKNSKIKRKEGEKREEVVEEKRENWYTLNLGYEGALLP
jgi:hypothetical protein